jgi:hypothetical protein
MLSPAFSMAIISSIVNPADWPIVASFLMALNKTALDKSRSRSTCHSDEDRHGSAPHGNYERGTKRFPYGKCCRTGGVLNWASRLKRVWGAFVSAFSDDYRCRASQQVGTERLYRIRNAIAERMSR